MTFQGPRACTDDRTLVAQVQGIQLSYNHIGKRPVSGEGHIQYYLDHIPKDAWSRVDLSRGYIGAAGTPTITLGLNRAPVRFSPGKHHVLAALAKNNRILYPATPSTVA